MTFTALWQFLAVAALPYFDGGFQQFLRISSLSCIKTSMYFACFPLTVFCFFCFQIEVKQLHLISHAVYMLKDCYVPS